MVKRYGLFYVEGNTMKMVVSRGFGAPLFTSEVEASGYVKTHPDYGCIVILPTFVSQEIAAKQTVEVYR